MKKIKVMILSGEGINCENETAQAFKRIEADVSIVTIRDWIQTPKTLDEFQILVLPGGFSYGDELHSGQILALELKYFMQSKLQSFKKKGGLILGICNGFQILMKLGLFESPNHKERSFTLYHNDSFEFKNRWVECLFPKSHCIWTQGIDSLFLPIRHGEGRVIFKTQKSYSKHAVALEYKEDVNGSYASIAGMTDETGQILGLMPHPEAALERWLYPKGINQDPGSVLRLFENAINHCQEHA
jgi:phosphoribosylformylglycinamidine synthase subunit PurQ / glutaminase